MSVSTPPSQFRPEVPASIWGRSGRPRWATIIRLYIAFSLIWIGLFFDGGIARWAWIGAGVGVFLLFPALTRLLLRPLEREVRTATRRTASHRLGLLRARRLVRTFAPHGWRSSQEATLHLIAGDGQAAAQAYAETGRLARLREPSAELLSGQVHAWILAKDLSRAREVSSAREKLGDLGPWDRLHRAVLLLAAGQRDDGVRGELEELRGTLGDHPWILAGLILAQERDGELDRALALSEEAAGVGDDELAATLLKRAEKGLRAYKKEQQRQERKRAKAQEKSKGAGTKEDARSAQEASEDPRNPRGSKKARKQARREARRRAKAEERHRRSEEAARRQRELKTRAQRAKKTPEPSEATAPQVRAAEPQNTAAQEGAAVRESAAARSGVAGAQSAGAQIAAAPQSATPAAGQVVAAGQSVAATQSAANPAAGQSAAPKASVSAPVIPSASASSVQSSSKVSTAPAPASITSEASRGGVILPPLVRPGERAASSRSKPPPPPVRARGPRTAVPTPRPPRLNLPRLVGSPPAAGLPTRSAKQSVAEAAPRILVPPPVVTAPQEESGDWGDLDTLFQD